MSTLTRRLRDLVSCVAAIVTTCGAAPSAGAPEPGQLYSVALPDGRSATVYADGHAKVWSKDHRHSTTRFFPVAPPGRPGMWLHPPDKTRAVAALMAPAYRPFVSGTVIVVYADAVAPRRDVVALDRTALAALRSAEFRARTSGREPSNVPEYTGDTATDKLLAALGADRQERLFRRLDRGMLASLHARGQAQAGHALLNFANAYRLHLTGASVRSAVQRLSKLPTIAYASPEWTISAMNTGAVPLPASEIAAARERATRLRARSNFGVTSNYGLNSSLQSFLNAPSVDAAAAYDELVSKYHQVPGTGETITNVSLGDLDDIGAATNQSDPCYGWVNDTGPTTVLIGGRRFIDWPSMPLIPTYTADDSGNLDGAGEVCGVDPALGEVGLDFSVMAPLPHTLQRPSNPGFGTTDLLGIAPGAQYRLVVPASFDPNFTDIQGALLGAALQVPRPNVITASLGYGFDYLGVSSRYLEDDPLTESLVASIVANYGIVVCVAAGDGIRTFGGYEGSNVATGPWGGSAETDVAPPLSATTNLADIELSGTPSKDFDSGSIDVGGSTLDDIFSAPPAYAPPGGYLQAQHAFPETRYSGYVSFASGYGTRVNVSAPSDNIISFSHSGAANTVYVGLNGGTSASAPETAAAAAVLLQLGRLTGRPLSGPGAVRSLLEQTAVALPKNEQADEVLPVGPQIDLRRAVEALMTQAHQAGTPAVHRVAVQQRRNNCYGALDASFFSDTDAENIDLDSVSYPAECADDAEHLKDLELAAWITIAPDWEWLPSGTTYRLFVTSRPSEVLATTPFARLLPTKILNAAGLPIASSATRTIHLTYEAMLGRRVLASAPVTLGLGPSGAAIGWVPAPKVPTVVNGATIPVSYDLTPYLGSSPPQGTTLLVTVVDRFAYGESPGWQIAEQIPITKAQGTIDVPVPPEGDGIYGVEIANPFSDCVFVRVRTSGEHTAKPPVPLLSSAGSQPGHTLEIPYGASFRVDYDVRNVPGATGAAIEISAPGPGLWGNFSPFNNPNGSVRDANFSGDGYRDSGSVYYRTEAGASGSVTVNAMAAGLVPSFDHTIRVLPLAGSTVAGEASDIGTIIEDGVVPADGGFLSLGFDVNSAGTDGLLSSNQVDASGNAVSSLETFDSVNAQITSAIDAVPNEPLFLIGGSTSGTSNGTDVGILANDVGIFGQAGTWLGQPGGELPRGPFVDVVLPSVAGGAAGPTWNLATTPATTLVAVARNQTTNTAAFLATDLPPGITPAATDWRYFTADLATRSVGPLQSLPSNLDGLYGFSISAIAQDTTDNKVVMLGDFLANGYTPSTAIITYDPATGLTTDFVTSDYHFGGAYLLAVDSHTHLAAIAGQGGYFVIYDLRRQRFHIALLPGSTPNDYGSVGADWVSVDEQNGRFLVGEAVAYDRSTDDNSLSHVVVLEENGRVLKDDSRHFNFFPNLNAGIAQQVQYAAPLIPKRHTGFVFSWDQLQLEPFSY